MTWRIGLGQMLVEGGQPQANLARARQMIGRAAAAGCQFVVLPECLDLGWTDPSARLLAQPIPGPHSDALAAAAAACQVHVVAGLVERDGDRLYNSAVLADPRGAARLVHRKINELDIALDLYTRGDRLAVVRTDLGTLGVNICADNFPDSLSLGRALVRMGAQIILSPCAWAVVADHDHEREPYGELWRGAYGELARLERVPVVGASGVGVLRAGPWQGRKLIGCSLAVGTDSQVLATGPYGADAAALVVVDVEPRTSDAASPTND